jgi:secreted Zn-dependent insulinase-like peptidase
VTFFNDFITTNEGHFNGFTDKDTTTFIYEINKEKFLESLDVFLNFFVKPLFKSEHVEKEIFAVNSEFEKNIHSDEKRFDRLFQAFSNPLHPFHKFSTGNKDTLKDTAHHKLRELVVKYFHKHYVGRNIKLVVYGNYELKDVEKIIINNMHKINNNYHISQKDRQINKIKEKYGKTDRELEIFTEKEKGKIIFFKSRYKIMKIYYIMKDFKNDLENNPKHYFKKLFSMRYKNSLIDTLIRHRLIFNLQLDFKDKYNNLSAIGFKFLLTEHGLRNVDLIIRLLSRYIQVFHKNIQNEEIFNKIAQSQSRIFDKQKPIKNPYKSLKKLTKNFYLFGKNNFFSADNFLYKYNPNVIHEFIKNMTLHNSIIFVGSRSFKHFDESYLYKVLMKMNHTHFGGKENLHSEHEIKYNFNKNYTRHNHNHSHYFSENLFLNKKEKWYKTRYTEFKIDHDDIWHIFRRKLKNANIVFPSFNQTFPEYKIEDFSLCRNEYGKKIKLKDCKKLFKNDQKFLTPKLINKQGWENFAKSETSDVKNFDKILNKTNLNNTYIHSEIYHKLDRTHLTKSFNLKLKIEPISSHLDLSDPKTIPHMKFLIIYLNFLARELQVDSEYDNNIHNKFISIKFLDNIRKETQLFSWRNSKEKLNPEDYKIDGIYIDIISKSQNVYEKSDIEKMLKTILDRKIDRRDFLYLKEELYRFIEFYKSSNPSHQALNWLYRLGFSHDVDYFNMTHLIKEISLDEVNKFKENIFSMIKIKSLAVGSIEEHKARYYIQSLENIFKEYIKSLPEIQNSNHPLEKDFNITTQNFIQAPYTKYGSHFIFQKNNLYKHSPDSTTLHVYFLGENSIYNNVNMKLLQHIAGNIFFSYLRIKHQLGYSVKNKLVNIDNNLMFYIHVQGSKKHPSHVQNYIDKVIPLIKTKIAQFDERTFESLKEKFYEKMTSMKKELNYKSSHYWNYLLGQETIFNKKSLKEYIDRLTLSDLTHFTEKIIDKRLSIQVANTNTKYERIDKESIYINDLDYFKNIAKFGTPQINENESEKINEFRPITSMRIDLTKAFKKNNQIYKP